MYFSYQRWHFKILLCSWCMWRFFWIGTLSDRVSTSYATFHWNIIKRSTSDYFFVRIKVLGFANISERIHFRAFLPLAFLFLEALKLAVLAQRLNRPLMDSSCFMRKMLALLKVCSDWKSQHGTREYEGLSFSMSEYFYLKLSAPGASAVSLLSM